MLHSFLLTGPDEGLKKSYIEQQIKRFSSNNQNIDRRKFYYKNSNIQDIVEFLQSPSIFGEYLIVEFISLDTFSEKEIEPLINICKQAKYFDGLMFFIGSDASIKLSHLEPLLTDKKIFWEMFDNKKQGWIYNIFKEEGYHIENDAISLLLELVENHTDTLKEACLKIIHFKQPSNKIITKDLVDEVIMIHSKKESPFSLFLAIFFNNLEDSLNIWQVISLSKQDTVFSLIYFILKQLNKILTIKTKLENNENINQACYSQQITSKKYIQNIQQICYKISTEQLKQMIILTPKLDNFLKSSSGTIEKNIFIFYLYNLHKIIH